MGADGALVGREAELTAIGAFLRGPTAGGLVLLGEAGLGKSALWQAAGRLATELGTPVLVATPGEGEERYSGSVLLDLLGDVDLAGVGLAEPLQSALDAVLLRRAATGAPDPQAIAVAVRDVLAHLARERDVVVLVDDVQWADPTSLDALAFAARRLGQTTGAAGATATGTVRFVLTRRSGYDRSALEAVLLRQTLVSVEPRPLTADETARLLLQKLALSLSPRVIRLVHEQSRGNPLFALEVGRVLLARGIPPIGEPLGVPEEMATVLGLRVLELPEAHRTLLLAVALDPLVREDALAELVGVDAVQSAVASRLVTIGEQGRVRAWHPLLAAAAREAATPARQRALHLRLAELETRPGGRARHLALGTSDAGEDLARLLAEESATAAARGAVETGVELAELALARTPAGSPERPQRVLDLATRLADAAEEQRVTDFLSGEIASLPAGRMRAAGWLMLLDGVVGSMTNVSRIIEEALAACGEDPDALPVKAQALDMKALMHVGMLVAGVPQALEWAEQSLALGSASGQGRAWCLVHSGREPEGAEGMAHRKRHLWRGEPARVEEWLVGSIAISEAEGRFRPAMSMRIHLVDLLIRSGRIPEARAHVAALDDADLAGKESPDEEVMHALVDARAGHAGAARDWADLGGRRAAEFGHVWLGLDARRALAGAALVEGRLEEAEVELRAVWDHGIRAGVRDPGIFPVAPDLAVTLALLGRTEEASGVLGWLRHLAEEQQHPWGLACVEHVEAVIGLLDGTIDVADVVDRTEVTADGLASLGLPHDAARACLVVGGELRRRRQWGTARRLLERAHDGFVATGADGWARVAAGELTKVGGRQKLAEDQLTPAELATATLAADGLSNKEIARRVGVSVGTVEAHLTRAYGKLGVRSRSQLAARLPG